MKLEKVIGKSSVVPVILGSSANAYGIVRSFGEYEISSVVVDYIRGPAFYSKNVCGIQYLDQPDREINLIRALLEIGEEIECKNKKAMIFITSDDYLVMTGKNRVLLENKLIFPMSEWKVIESCTNKRMLYECACKIGIPLPKTFVIDNISKMNEALTVIPFPCIVKPIMTVGFNQQLGLHKKVIIVNNTSEMNELINIINDKKLDSISYIIQEVIPGDAKSLYTLSAYSNSEADIIAWSTGHKIRQSPPDAGTITSGFVQEELDLFELGRKLLKGMKLHGISNTEFKLDVRDGQFKLIEINPRPGLWNYSATASGVNLPYECYKDILGAHDGDIVSSDVTLTWCLGIPDFVNVIYRYKKLGYEKDQLSILKWVKSIKNHTVFAILNRADPLPFVFYVTHMVFYALKTIILPLSRKSKICRYHRENAEP